MFKSVQWGPKKKPLTPSPVGHIGNNRGIKGPRAGGKKTKKKKQKKPDDVNKKPNIPLFHIGTRFSFEGGCEAS